MHVELGIGFSSEELGPNEIVRAAALAEEVGFTTAWVSDHYHPWINAHLPPVDEWPAALLDLLPPDAPRNNWRRTLLRVLARTLYPAPWICTASESC